MLTNHNITDDRHYHMLLANKTGTFSKITNEVYTIYDTNDSTSFKLSTVLTNTLVFVGEFLRIGIKFKACLIFSNKLQYWEFMLNIKILCFGEEPNSDCFVRISKIHACHFVANRGSKIYPDLERTVSELLEKMFFSSEMALCKKKKEEMKNGTHACQHS